MWYANMDSELLITAFFNRIQHPGEASLSTALNKNDREFRWHINDLGIRRVKSKPIPLQVWTGPECSRRFRLPDFKTIGT